MFSLVVASSWRRCGLPLERRPSPDLWDAGRSRAALCALLLTLPLLSCTSATPAPSPIPPRPELLELEAPTWVPPDAAALRTELGNGIPVYALADAELPLVTVTVLFRGGSYLDPEGREGLAELTAALWPAGGAGDLGADELDDELARLAAEATVAVEGTRGSLTLDVLSANLEPALGLLRDLLTRPVFDPERLRQARADALEALRSRVDDPERLEELEWLRLVYGDSYWLNRAPTPASLEAVEARDCRLLVDRLARAGNLVVAVAGDFDPAAIAGHLEPVLGDLPRLESPLPPIPPPEPPGPGGVWLLDLPESVQARVLLGHQGLPLGHPDEVPLLALDQVLGGAFTSRLVSRIRSEEGLAYDVYSESSFPSGYPGAIRVGFQTRSSACAHATATALEAARELRLEEVSPAELGRAREALLALLRDRFGSAVSAVVAMAEDELGGRPASYWSTYRDRVAALTAADLRAAAERHLDPERMRVLVIGDRDAVGQGDPAYPERLADLGLGPVRPLPERDPLTLEPTADDRN